MKSNLVMFSFCHYDPPARLRKASAEQGWRRRIFAEGSIIKSPNRFKDLCGKKLVFFFEFYYTVQSITRM